jgi:hypothetical protein
MKKLVALTVALAATSIINVSRAQTTIADWTFQSSSSTNNIIGAGDTPGTTQSGVLADIGTGTASASHAASATAWSIPAGNGSTNSWSANNWAVGDYYQFAVSTVGFANINISYDQAGSSTGPGNFLFEYSTDGSTFTPVGSAYTVSLSTWSPSTNQTAFTFSYNLSSVSGLNNDPTAVFRIVDNATTSIGGGTVASGGTDRVDNFIAMSVPVPEPSTLALAAMGMAGCLLVFRRRGN